LPLAQLLDSVWNGSMASPRVTVIIATYNWSTVLPYAIGSVLNQTMRDYELLVIGDGCTDDSEQVVAAIKDPRVRWINLPANTGHQAGPNNRGIEEAKGEFVAYLGHDDLWLRHHLQCMTDKLDETGAGVAHSLLARILPGRDIGMPVMPIPEHGMGGPPSCTMYRRSVTDKIGGWKNYRELNVAPRGRPVPPRSSGGVSDCVPSTVDRDQISGFTTKGRVSRQTEPRTGNVAGADTVRSGF
jgi:hypothetical protein